MTYEVRVLDLLHDLDVVKLDVEVLIHALEGSLELDVVLELHGDLVVDEGLEKARELRSVLRLSASLAAVCFCRGVFAPEEEHG